MSSLEIRKVENRRDLKTFIEFHYELYQGNKYDAPTLYSDDAKVLNPKKNAAFEFCEAELYLAYKEGKVVGREPCTARCRWQIWQGAWHGQHYRATWLHRYGPGRHAYRGF